MKDKYKHKFLEDAADDWYPFEPIVKPIKRKRVEKESVKPKEKVKKRIKDDLGSKDNDFKQFRT